MLVEEGAYISNHKEWHQAKISGPPPKWYKEAPTSSEKKVELEEEDEEH